MDNELQDALNVFDHSDERMTARQWTTILEAARKVANPDYEAAAKRRFEDVKPRFDTEWLDLRADERDEWIAEVKPYVDAALGVTEDADAKG